MFARKAPKFAFEFEVLVISLQHVATKDDKIAVAWRRGSKLVSRTIEKSLDDPSKTGTLDYDTKFTAQCKLSKLRADGPQFRPKLLQFFVQSIRDKYFVKDLAKVTIDLADYAHLRQQKEESLFIMVGKSEARLNVVIRGRLLSEQGSNAHSRALRDSGVALFSPSSPSLDVSSSSDHQNQPQQPAHPAGSSSPPVAGAPSAANPAEVIRRVIAEPSPEFQARVLEIERKMEYVEELERLAKVLPDQVQRVADDIKDRCDEVEKEMEGLKTLVSEVTAQSVVSQLVSDNKALRERLLSDIQKLRTEYEHIIEKLRKEMIKSQSDMSKELEEKTSAAWKSKLEVETLKGQLEKLKLQLDNTRVECERIRASSAAALASYASSSDSAAASSPSVDKSKDGAEALQRLEETYKNKKQKLVRELYEREELITKLQKSRTEQLEQMRTLETRVQELQKHESKLMDKVVKHKEESGRLRLELDQLRQEKMNAEDKARKATDQLELLQSELAAERIRTKQMEFESEQRKRQLDELRHAYDELQQRQQHHQHQQQRPQIHAVSALSPVASSSSDAVTISAASSPSAVFGRAKQNVSKPSISVQQQQQHLSPSSLSSGSSSLPPTPSSVLSASNLSAISGISSSATVIRSTKRKVWKVNPRDMSGDSLRTITEALEKSASGDIILLSAGVYEESIVVRKSVQIQPEGAADGGSSVAPVTIRGKGIGGQETIQIVRGKPHFVGIMIENSGDGGSCVVDISNGEPIFENCSFSTHNSSSLSMDGSSSASSSNGNDCVHVHGSKTAPEFISCKFQGGKIGYYAYDSSKGKLSDCTLMNCSQYGVAVTTNADPVISDCSISKCGESGFYAFRGGLGTVQRSRIFLNVKHGVCITTAAAPNLSDNIIEEEKRGVYIAEGGSGTIASNRILRCFSGIVVEGSGSQPAIHRNQIQNESVGGSSSSSSGASGTGIRVSAGAAPELCENTVSKYYVGLELSDSAANCLASRNDISQVAIGVNVKKGGAGTLQDNDIEGSEEGVFIETGAALFLDNRIKKNVRRCAGQAAADIREKNEVLGRVYCVQTKKEF